MENNTLRVPVDSSMIKGEKNEAHDTWYTYVNWLAKPTGDLTLSYYTKYNDGDWKTGTQGTLNVYEEGKLERFEWAKIARRALGLNRPNVKIPGKVRVYRNLLSGDECIGINFETPWPNNPHYYIHLQVTDDDNNSFLNGFIDMYK